VDQAVDPEHQVEGVHYRHHHHKVTPAVNFVTNFVTAKIITSDFPGELAGGRGVRQPPLGQCFARNRSPL
jgi:hypothetical protein